MGFVNSYLHTSILKSDKILVLFESVIHFERFSSKAGKLKLRLIIGFKMGLFQFQNGAKFW